MAQRRDSHYAEGSVEPSKFNIVFRIDDTTTLVYNTFSNALAELTDREGHHLKEWLERPTDDYFERHGLTDLRDTLVKLGVIVARDYDEVERLKSLSTNLKQQDRRFGLTIVPTLACNFRCGYCFSYASTQRIDSGVRRKLLEFSRAHLENADSLFVSWFGGEPTLCIDIIEDLSSELQHLCEQTRTQFEQGSIVTNGYLLSRSVAARIRAAGIARAQITIDGDRETHDERRPLLNGSGTFDRILENIENSCDLLDVQIRVNLDRNDLRSAIGALDALKSRGLNKKVGVYFGHVRAFSDACSDISGACLSNQEFSRLQLEMTRQAIARGFCSFPYPRVQPMGICGADKPLNYVVAPNGLLFKCWAEASLGEGWSVGSLMSEEATKNQKRNNHRFLSWDPFSDDTCHECEFLPICMGGCPHMRIRGHQDEDCTYWRFSLLETLAMRYKLGDQVRFQRSANRKEVRTTRGS